MEPCYMFVLSLSEKTPLLISFIKYECLSREANDAKNGLMEFRFYPKGVGCVCKKITEGGF